MNQKAESNVIPRLDRRVKRNYTQAYKLKILELGSRCKDLTELNQLLSREKLHSAQLSKWWREFSHQQAFVQKVNQPIVEQLPPSESTHNNGHGGSSTGGSSHETTIDPREILAKIWRRKGLLFTTMLVSMLLAITFLSSVTPSYTSRALIMIGNRDIDLSVKGIIPSIQVDVGTMQNQLEILRSYSIAERVIEKFDLDQLAEFNPALKEKGFFAELLGSLKSDKPSPNFVDANSTIPHGNVPVIESFLKKQKLALVGESRLIELKFTSHDPVLSAKISNSILDIYLNDQIESKFADTNKANNWLNKRVEDLRLKVTEAENAVENYRKTKGLLMTSKGITLNSQQMSELNTQLVLASTDRAEKEARLAQARRLAKKDLSSSAGVINSELIRRLREQENALESNLAELSAAYGAKHPRIINLQAEKSELKAKIAKEMQKIVVGLKNETNISRVREEQLRAQLKDLEVKLAGSNSQEVQLRALEREADATRKLLDTFLTRFKETNEQTNLEVQRADAKVISYATAARKPSFPQTGPILALAFFGSILLGLLSVFIRELFDKGFRSGVELEKDTSLKTLGLIPKISGFRAKSNNPVKHVQNFPASPLSEAIRSIHANMALGENIGHPNKVIQFTSAYPGEGKSTIAQCLALLKSQAGIKTIIIDADLRSPSIHTSLNVKDQPGLAEYLTGKVELHQVIIQHKTSGIYLIPAGKAAKSPTDLLPSKAMDTLLTDLKEVFDLIIIDSPPVLAVPDAKILSTKVDMTAFVVKWADTRKSVAKYAIKQLNNAGAKQVSTVLSMVDAKKHSKYSFADSGLYMGKFKHYYIEG